MIEPLPPDRTPDIVSVLCEAFRDYPVMRWVLSDSADYDTGLRRLVGFFTASRVHRDEPMLGARRGGTLTGVALLSRPERKSPPGLAALREETWSELGRDARARYETFGAAAGSIEIDVPHVHLNMLGVRDAARGTGVARSLLEAVHALSAADASTTGVSLTTETPKNVPLYEHFGYRVVGEADVAGTFTSWTMFRADDGTAAGHP